MQNDVEDARDEFDAEDDLYAYTSHCRKFTVDHDSEERAELEARAKAKAEADAEERPRRG